MSSFSRLQTRFCITDSAKPDAGIPRTMAKGCHRPSAMNETPCSGSRSLADQIIDSTDHTVHTLRAHLVARFSPDRQGAPMHVQVLSFGHKYGSPTNLELLFDVRHLPNPHLFQTAPPLWARQPRRQVSQKAERG